MGIQPSPALQHPGICTSWDFSSLDRQYILPSSPAPRNKHFVGVQLCGPAGYPPYLSSHQEYTLPGSPALWTGGTAPSPLSLTIQHPIPATALSSLEKSNYKDLYNFINFRNKHFLPSFSYPALRTSCCPRTPYSTPAPRNTHFLGA